MGICVINENGYSEVSIEGRNLLSRRLFLLGEIDSTMAQAFQARLLLLLEERNGNTIPPISIIIDSPGGSVDAGLMIYDLIKSLEGKVEISMYCTNQAFSMAAVILAGGQKGRRFILPHSKVMIHEPLIPQGARGSASEIKKTSEEIMKTKNLINTLLASDTGKQLSVIDKDTASDFFMDAEAAIKYGMCDAIGSPLEV